MADESERTAPTYYALFDGDEIDGRRYSLGEPIDAKAHSGVLMVLEAQARVSTTKPADAVAAPIPYDDKPVANMTRAELEGAMLAATSTRIAQASDDDLRNAVDRYRGEVKATEEGGDDDGQGNKGDAITGSQGEGGANDEKTTTPEKPLNRQTTAELEATAAAEEVTFGDDVKSNPDRIKAIEDARAKKEAGSAS